MADVDLAFLARQNERILNEMARFRDDVTVLTAITTRVDGSLSTLIEEVRTLHRQMGPVRWRPD